MSHGEPERSTNSLSFRPHAHASVSVNVHYYVFGVMADKGRLIQDEADEPLTESIAAH